MKYNKKFLNIFCFGFILSYLSIYNAFFPIICFAESNDVENILKQLENRYTKQGFKADFEQESRLSSIDISDHASGSIYIKYPGKLRWEYKTPQRQLYISNGKKLWIYKPDENQVILGNPLLFFGKGKGADILSNIEAMRENFEIFLEKDFYDHWILKLNPIDKSIALSDIYLKISKSKLEIFSLTSFDLYGDKNEITFKNIKFKKDINDKKFDFEIPKDAQIFEMDRLGS